MLNLSNAKYIFALHDNDHYKEALEYTKQTIEVGFLFFFVNLLNF